MTSEIFVSQVINWSD